ncbi:MAG: hypothetical protein GY927_01510 [bacterium]|nr:hypothetical protein [bacterium]
MNGIHLIKQDERGVTIQFHAMLIVALLQLRLKQKTAAVDGGDDDHSSEKTVHEPMEESTTEEARAAVEEHKEGRLANKQAAPEPPTEGAAGEEKILVADEHNEDSVATSQQQAGFDTEKPISSGYKFIETIGKNLKKYWKIGIHWLTALKELLDKPFDEHAVEILNSS